MAYRNYSVANGFTVDPSGNGDFTTIGAALTAATSGKDIFIRPGTYTENLTLKAGVNLVGFLGDETTPNVTIIGKLTYTVAGTCSVSNIRLQTNSDFFLVVSGSAASIINLENCYLNITNNTGISFTSSSSSAKINIINSSGNLSTTGIAVYSSSSNGQMLIIYSYITNSGGSTTANTNSVGSVNIQYSQVQNPCVSSGTGGIGMIDSTINTVGTNATAVQANGSGEHEFIGSNFNSLSGTAITIGGSATVLIEKTYIYSDATNAISGTGNLKYGTIDFAGTSSTFQNTLTLSRLESSPSNATSGALFASTGTNTAPAYTLTPSVTSITVGGGTALANYVEGTFTPVIQGTTTAGTATYVTALGYYTRIGRMVFVQIQLNWNTGTGTGNLRVGGLPFTVSSAVAIESTSVVYTNAVASTSVLYANFNIGASSIDLYGLLTTTGGVASVSYAASSTFLGICGSYFV